MRLPLALGRIISKMRPGRMALAIEDYHNAVMQTERLRQGHVQIVGSMLAEGQPEQLIVESCASAFCRDNAKEQIAVAYAMGILLEARRMGNFGMEKPQVSVPPVPRDPS